MVTSHDDVDDPSCSGAANRGKSATVALLALLQRLAAYAVQKMVLPAGSRNMFLDNAALFCRRV